jgi:hypothetical protein
MTNDQLSAICERLDAANTHAMSTQIEIDRDGTTRWINLGPFLCSSHDDAYRVRCLVTLMHHAPSDLRALLDEVDRLTADPLPAAAWVREVERAAFARGVEAMRQAVIGLAEPRATLPVKDGVDAAWCRSAQCIVDDVRALPVPEDR